ncbi:MAG: hypothetical protein IJ733_15295, partial [Lachnospiraceae bacterium]|nr:hypothetical protein [Lachnospiraceae bacterium]
MDNIRAVIGILFGRVSEQDIFTKKILYSDIPLSKFMALANSYIVRYTNDEISNLYAYLKTELKWRHHKLYHKPDDGKQRDINVFEVLHLFSDMVLTQENGQPVCQYLHFLRWHEMTKEIGEDSLVTSYLAFRDSRLKKRRTEFYWRPVIGHNSQALNRIMEKGLAENHFHLKGSAPLFHISWICMMNLVASDQIEEELGKYDERRLRRNIAYQGGYTENSLYTLCLRAAYIRFYLYRELRNLSNDKHLLDAIHTPADLLHGIDRLQGEIVFEQERNQNEHDYADNNGKKSLHHVNGILYGERWLLYEMFYRSNSKDSRCTSDMCQLFYYYLVVKNIIRAEFIQINDNIGF